MTNEQPLACTLSATDRRGRLARIEALGRDALTGVRRDGTLSFRNDPATRSELEAIVAAESDCCGFLELALRTSGSELLLTISAPAGAEPVARELAGAFQGQRG